MTMLPSDVAHHIVELEKLLVAAGIVPESRRTKKKAEKAVGPRKNDGRIPVTRRCARSAGHKKRAPAGLGRAAGALLAT
jgi:hypothetical protein